MSRYGDMWYIALYLSCGGTQCFCYLMFKTGYTALKGPALETSIHGCNIHV